MTSVGIPHPRSSAWPCWELETNSRDQNIYSGPFLSLSITEKFTSKSQYGKAFQGNIVLTATFVGEIILSEVLRTKQFKHKLCKEGVSRNSSHYIQNNFATEENSRMET